MIIRYGSTSVMMLGESPNENEYKSDYDNNTIKLYQNNNTIKVYWFYDGIKHEVTIRKEQLKNANIDEIFSNPNKKSYSFKLIQAIQLAIYHEKINNINEAIKKIKDNVNGIKISKNKYDEEISEIKKIEKEIRFINENGKNKSELENEIRELLEDLHNPKTNDQARENIKLCFLTLIRYFSFDSIDLKKIAKQPEEKNEETLLRDEQLKQLLEEIYKEAKDFYSLFSPYIARYSEERHLKELFSTYHPSSGKLLNLKQACLNDLEYGMKKRECVISLMNKINVDSDIASQFRDGVSQFLISEFANKMSFDGNDYGVIREEKQEEGSATSMTGRYSWGRDLVNSVYEHSNADDMKKEMEDSLKVMELKYENLILTQNTLFSKPLCLFYGEPPAQGQWNHGRLSVEDTWGFIVNITKKLWDIDLNEKSKENIAEFYSALAELLWLIGNTQPYFRGSGTLAETMFAVIHYHHGMVPPILKLEFPQLDVLDISFPLSDYKQLFTYFFEPSSLPECLQTEENHEIASLGRIKQLEAMYMKIKIKKDLHNNVTPSHNL